jgi:predicted transglutaminase-like cysteine proteinase
VHRRAIAGWAVVGLLGWAALANAQALPDLGFTARASTALAASYARKWGAPAADRIARWRKSAAEHKGTGYAGKLAAAAGREAALLQVVNEAVNRDVRGILDQDHWGVEDYWATPAETVASAGGDCEDYSIAKYYLLKELGVPIGRLRITYVRVLTQGFAHMVLAYYATPEAEPLILDNLEERVRRASERADLEPVYHFNDDELRLVKGGQRGKPAQIRAWLALQERLAREARL